MAKKSDKRGVETISGQRVPIHAKQLNTIGSVLFKQKAKQISTKSMSQCHCKREKHKEVCFNGENLRCYHVQSPCPVVVKKQGRNFEFENLG